MNAWRRALAVAAISGGSILAWSVGGSFLRTAQYAQAAQDVEAARQSLANVQDLANVYKAVGKVVEPSVVKIEVHKTVKATGSREEDLLRQFFPDRDGDGEPDVPEEFRRFHQNPDRDYEAYGTGSGVVMEVDGKTGYIVTNNHVAGGASEMTVTLSDGREIKDAKLVGADPKTDLAIVKVNAEGLIAAKWGNSDYLEKGDIICAFGSPFGYVGSMTHGIVSALNRDRVGIIGSRYAYENFIQVDAPINPGNSGGPLVNLRGEVVGINTAIASRTGSFAGIGFAIPSNQAKFVYDQIKDKGKVVRGWLGVGIENVASAKEKARASGYDGANGVFVTEVTRNAPSTGKILPGDVILALNGKAVENMSDLRNQIAATPPGTELRMDIVRDGEKKQVTVTLGEQPEETPQIASIAGGEGRGGAVTFQELGMRLARPTPELLQQHNLDDADGGALVTAVTPGSTAALAGLRPGDLITKVGETSVNSPQDVSKALTKDALGAGVRIYITNQEGQRLLFLKKSS
jgi:serine protease Do